MLPGFTKPNKSDPAKRSHEAGYQLGKLKRNLGTGPIRSNISIGSSIDLIARSGICDSRSDQLS